MNIKLIAVIGISFLLIVLVIYAISNAKVLSTTISTIGGTHSTGGILGSLLDGLNLSVSAT